MQNLFPLIRNQWNSASQLILFLILFFCPCCLSCGNRAVWMYSYTHHLNRAAEHRLGIDQEPHDTFNLILTTLEKLPTLLNSKWSPRLSSNSSLTSPHNTSLTLDCFMTLKRPITFLQATRLSGLSGIWLDVLPWARTNSQRLPPTFFAPCNCRM